MKKMGLALLVVALVFGVGTVGFAQETEVNYPDGGKGENKSDIGYGEGSSSY